ncbi:MAG: general secretion pathway protein GspB [Motiliproteus sp.]
MSYILDALKQSDRQRQRGKVPDLQSWQPSLDSPVTPSRRWPTRVLGGTLLVAALLLFIFQGGFLHGDGSSQVPSADAPHGEEVTDLLAAPVPLEPEQGRAESELLTLPEEATADLRVQLEVPVTTVPSSIATDVPGSGPAPAVAVVTQATEPVQENEQVTGQTTGAASNPKVQDLTLTWGGSEERISKEALAKINPFDPSRIKSKPRTSASSNPDSKAGRQVNKESVIYWRQLPLSVQRNLPPLDFTVHIYSENPASRMVKINGVSMREGQRVSLSLRLERITPEGVILAYKGYRFRMNAI